MIKCEIFRFSKFDLRYMLLIPLRKSAFVDVKRFSARKRLARAIGQISIERACSLARAIFEPPLRAFSSKSREFLHFRYLQLEIREIFT